LIHNPTAPFMFERSRDQKREETGFGMLMIQ